MKQLIFWQFLKRCVDLRDLTCIEVLNIIFTSNDDRRTKRTSLNQPRVSYLFKEKYLFIRIICYHVVQCEYLSHECGM